MPALTLVSHHLCPYVQRAAISLAEKRVPFERIYVDLGNKPGWFETISPLGKVPVLVVEDGRKENVIFESAVILEFLEDTQPHPLHPEDPVERARHRAWIEYGSAILAAIWRFYSANQESELAAQAAELSAMFDRVQAELAQGHWFGGDRFGLVDAVYGPIFRYFDAFDRIGQFGILEDKPRLAAWRARLAKRPSVRGAVSRDYPDRLWRFLEDRNSALSAQMSA